MVRRAAQDCVQVRTDMGDTLVLSSSLGDVMQCDTRWWIQQIGQGLTSSAADPNLWSPAPSWDVFVSLDDHGRA